MQKKVNIIMSTYNGEHFLVEQLDSLCNQTYENIDIYIRDDGSTDNTREILKKYIVIPISKCGEPNQRLVILMSEVKALEIRNRKDFIMDLCLD